MYTDSYSRTIDYLRISVTDRCNLRCLYCMPGSGIVPKAPGDILTFEEIVAIARKAAEAGIDKIKITGGEPLLRRGLPELFSLLFSVSGLHDISLTTNGVLLARYAKELKEAGLKRVNISIDTLRQGTFERITRVGRLAQVLQGIDAAKSRGFLVKLNVVVLRGINDGEIADFVRFAQEKNVIVRFIELMPMAQGLNAGQDLFVPCDEIKERLEVWGALSPVDADVGSGPACYYKIEGTSVIVGFISPISRKFCFECNRLRLTADGLLMPCLSSPSALDLRGPLRRNNEEEIVALLKKAIRLKPQGHTFTFASCGMSLMSQVGG